MRSAARSAATVLALATSATAFAQAPLAQGQAPGWYRMAPGSFQVTAPMETSVNGYLVHTGSKLVLIDTGAAGLFGPTLGKLVANLKTAGYQPEQVDEIDITHMHPDHVGGLVAAVQFALPATMIQFDVNSQEAAPAHIRQYADAAKGGCHVAVAHTSFPGIGRLRADGKGYDWIPANCQSAP